MAERPILFSGPMVRAIIEGRKTQTRRVIRDDWWRCLSPDDEDDRAKAVAQCPYGQPGDVLWVRETWGPCAGGVAYRANDAGAHVECPDGGRWRPSIHMPRWASRLSLRVTGVRVERLQEISEADARAEGVALAEACTVTGHRGDVHSVSTYRCGLAAAWDSLNGKRAPWASNPWVWVVEFAPAPPAKDGEDAATGKGAT